jgi:hypothetical protein
MRLQPPQLQEDPLEAIAASDVGGDSSASIDAWLNVVSRLMHLPEATRREICSELREHLRERVRDLLLLGGAGSDERDALRQAIDELGETAQLARRFEAANQPRTRRTVMHALLALVGAGAVAAGVMTFTPNRNASPTAFTRYESASAVVAEPPKSLTDAKCALAADASLRDALESVITQANVGLMVDWGQIESNGVDPSAPLGLSFKDMPGTRALTLIAQTAGGASGGGLGAVDWRMRDGELVEFGLRSELDRREIELITYDITETLLFISNSFTDSADEAVTQVTDLLTTMVEPERWRDNGGDLAHMKFVGGRLFIEAPRRMHERVRWILDQLPTGKHADENAALGNDAAGEGVPVLDQIPVISNFFRKNEVRRVLNPGDTVTVSIFELYQPTTWATTTRQINEVGMYRVSEIGDVRAAGRTIDEFEGDVVRELMAKVMAITPDVNVTLENAVVVR